MENEPDFDKLRFKGEPVEFSPYTARLFNFIGRIVVDGMEVEASDYDHIKVDVPDADEEGKYWTMYVFSPHEIYEDLALYMVEHEFPLHVHLRRPAESDILMFNTVYYSDSTDLPPESWPEKKPELPEGYNG